MRRDPTVVLSFVMMFGGWITGAAISMPESLDTNPPVHEVIFWITFAGALRATVLWFQTLIHGIDHSKPENRVAVVLGHIFLGPIMSYAYYYSSRRDVVGRHDESREGNS